MSRYFLLAACVGLGLGTVTGAAGGEAWGTGQPETSPTGRQPEPAPAREVPPREGADKAPTGEEILERFVEKTGGRAAYEKVQSRITTMRVQAEPAQKPMSMVQYAVGPNKLAIEMTAQGFGRTTQTTDGTLAWETSDAGANGMGGGTAKPRALTGDERDVLMERAIHNSEIRYKEIYSKIENVGESPLNGKIAYRVELTFKKGPKATYYFDKETGLLVKTVTTVKTSTGDLAAETLVSDYKKVGDLLISHRAMQKITGYEQVFITEKVELNAKIAPEKFIAPKEITEAPAGPGELKPPSSPNDRKRRN